MANETNKTVTISAEYYAELYRMQNERNLFCEVNARLTNERDELKKEIESECADKLKVIKELNEVRELNRKCCDENKELRAKLDGISKNYISIDQVKPLKDKFAAAERCIEEAFEAWTHEDGTDASYNRIGDIIRAYRENREAK